jgi:hypothetical protein
MTKEATMTKTERELHRLSKQVTRAAEHFLELLLAADPEALRNNEYYARYGQVSGDREKHRGGTWRRGAR